MALDDDIALLSRVPTLGTIEKDALRLLAFSAEPRSLATGDVLFRQGDVADGGFVIARGVIALVTDDYASLPTILGANALIGEYALISESRRPATAVAREDSLVLRIPRVLFRRTLEEYPHIAERLAREIHGRMLATTAGLAVVRDRLDRMG